MGMIRPETVFLIGGGLTDAHLALGAARRGASVDLISRRALRVRAFDTDPGWLGPKRLADFESVVDFVQMQRFTEAFLLLEQ